MSRRERCAQKKAARARVARAKVLRRRARGTGARAATAATAAAFTLAGVAASAGNATPSVRAEPLGVSGSAAAPLARCPDPGARSSRPADFVDVKGTLFFTADDGVHGRELWKSDGTSRGTVMVTDVNPGTNDDDGPTWLTAVGGRLFFTADDGVHGRELWKSDGTRAGTVMVKDIDPRPQDDVDYGYGPIQLTAMDGTLFFAAQDGHHGTELWKSSGTKGGTVLVEDIYRGRGRSFPNNLTPVDGKLFFLADNTHGMELWKSNGTKAGTVLVKRVEPHGPTNDYDYGPTYLTALAGKLFFSDDNEASGTELWKSNGTRSGTVMVKDIYPGRPDGGYDYYRPYSSYPSGLTAVRGKVFFSATDGAHGSELWKSNGTKAGTVLVNDIRTGDDASAPSNLTDVAGRLFFTAKEGVHGRELWSSNGTKAGTVLVKDIRTGEDNSSPSSLTAVGGALFFTANDAVHGPGLWKSNGSRRGTVMVKDIRPCSDEGGWPSSLTRVGSELYFAADDGVHGLELWKSDGTRSGTVLVKDLETGGS